MKTKFLILFSTSISLFFLRSLLLETYILEEETLLEQASQSALRLKVSNL